MSPLLRQAFNSVVQTVDNSSGPHKAIKKVMKTTWRKRLCCTRDNPSLALFETSQLNIQCYSIVLMDHARCELISLMRMAMILDVYANRD